MAWSARASSSSKVTDGSRVDSTPMLALMRTVAPPDHRAARAMAAWIRCDHLAHLVLGQRLAERHELVAAEPGHRVDAAHDLAQAAGDLDQHLVADACGRRCR